MDISSYKNGDASDRVKFWVSMLFRLILASTAVLAAFADNWLTVGIAGLALLLTFLPSIIEKRYTVDYPSEYEILVLVLIFSSFYLGEIEFFYDRFWWWDLMLHGFAGFIFGALGLSLVAILAEGKAIVSRSPFFAMLFAFCFAMAAGAIWEIIEYLMDTLFGLHTQTTGLNDTMTDLILDLIGALSLSTYGYIHLKYNFRIGAFASLAKKFMDKNKNLFRRDKKQWL